MRKRHNRDGRAGNGRMARRVGEVLEKEVVPIVVAESDRQFNSGIHQRFQKRHGERIVRATTVKSREIAEANDAPRQRRVRQNGGDERDKPFLRVGELGFRAADVDIRDEQRQPFVKVGHAPREQRSATGRREGRRPSERGASRQQRHFESPPKTSKSNGFTSTSTTPSFGR